MPKQLYDIRNYPRRSGTSQLQRIKPVLTGGEVKIDERTIADFILFANKLSQHLTYYNLNNVPQGTWAQFLQNDIAYHLAEATANKSTKWQQVWQELMENIEGANGAAATDNDHQKYFTWRFNFLYTLIGKLMNAYAHSNLLSAWQKDLEALYSSAHLITLYILLEKYAQASQPLLLADAGNFSYNDIQLLSKDAVAVQLLQYGKEVLSLSKSDQSFLTDATFIFGEAATIPEKVAAASEYLDELAGQLIALYNSVTILADKYLNQTLNNDNTHQPHVGLFYAFLKLSEEHRTEVNGLLLRHLHFYYTDVLGVRPKVWKPAKAFVTFELAKNVTEHFLPAGTLLQAGKDGGRKDVHYQTLQDIVVTGAEVADIRSFTILKNISPAQKNVRTGLGMFGSMIANSADGAGKPLLPGQSWDAFRGSNAANANQQIGLAFYSELLHQSVAEICNFEIQIKLQNAGRHAAAATLIEKYGTVKISIDKEPLLLPVKATESGGFINVSFTVSGKKNISKTSPNASLIFGNKYESVDASDMDAITTFQTERIVNLFFAISNYTVKVNNVETAAGVTDVSSAFPAFGGVPKSGSTFSVIAPLLHKKAASSLHLRINWASDTERSFNISTSFAGQTLPFKIEAGKSQSDLLLTTGTSSVKFPDDSITVKLLENLGHSDYANKMTAAILAHQEDPDEEDTGVLSYLEKYVQEKGIVNRRFEEGIIGKRNKSFSPPPAPYTPMIKSLELEGNFRESIFLDGGTVDKVFRQYPYGIKKMADTLNVFLLPSFTISSSIADSSEGELYIGIKNAQPGQRLQLLFAVEEGGANPGLQNPQVSWSCLQYDSWVSFAEGTLHDDTNNLIQSGIVSFLLPDTDITSHQLLPSGLCWIKAAVPFNDSNAVAPIISIHAQAVLTEFINQNNTADYLGSNIPANTISALFPKQSAIKKITQPYSSFGGRQTEQATDVYTRTSERLRHKSRGVTAWDYEHILLQKFPDIYKVKVLHHACPCADSTGVTKKIISKAGSVLILVMPKTHAQMGLYKPLVSEAKLTAIHQYIQSLSSPFTQLTVMNPMFDEIALSFQAVFTRAIQDRLVYEKKLGKDVQRFLSPWAFNDTAEPEFGGVIYRSSLIDFIESLPYVDYVKNLRLSLSGNATDSLDSVTPSSPASILISGSMAAITGQLHTCSEETEKQQTIAFC